MASLSDITGRSRVGPSLGLAVGVIAALTVIRLIGLKFSVVDLFFDGAEAVAIEGERHPGGASHGSGCTHSAALAAFLAHGETPLQAARSARAVASAAVAAGLREIGRGAGPVDVFGLAAKAGAGAEGPD